MALKYPDRIESNNPQAYGIVKATEVSGARNAAEYGGLLDIPDNILSANSDGSDALYQLWIDDNSVYRLVDWNNRHNSKGWQIEYAYIPWDSTAHLNSLTQSGQYYISGQSNGLNGGLPILNSDPGHTFDAILRVLDSSLTKDKNEKQLCITQILSFSNRMGGDGHIFVRTIQTLEKDNLTRTDIESPTCNKWGSWEKLMGVFEKNAVTNITDLDTYTTNGMYSGLFADTTLQSLGGLQFTPGDTFLLITVNGYAASAFGTPQLTQILFKFPVRNAQLPTAANMYLRVAHQDADNKKWAFENFKRMATNDELSSQVATLMAKINQNAANIASANEAASEAITTAQEAQAAADSAQTKNSELELKVGEIVGEPEKTIVENTSSISGSETENITLLVASGLSFEAGEKIYFEVNNFKDICSVWAWRINGGPWQVKGNAEVIEYTCVGNETSIGIYIYRANTTYLNAGELTARIFKSARIGRLQEIEENIKQKADKEYVVTINTSLCEIEDKINNKTETDFDFYPLPYLLKYTSSTKTINYKANAVMSWKKMDKGDKLTFTLSGVDSFSNNPSDYYIYAALNVGLKLNDFANNEDVTSKIIDGYTYSDWKNGDGSKTFEYVAKEDCYLYVAVSNTESVSNIIIEKNAIANGLRIENDERTITYRERKFRSNIAIDIDGMIVGSSINDLYTVNLNAISRVHLHTSTNGNNISACATYDKMGDVVRTFSGNNRFETNPLLLDDYEFDVKENEYTLKYVVAHNNAQYAYINLYTNESVISQIDNAKDATPFNDLETDNENIMYLFTRMMNSQKMYKDMADNKLFEYPTYEDPSDCTMVYDANNFYIVGVKPNATGTGKNGNDIAQSTDCGIKIIKVSRNDYSYTEKLLLVEGQNVTCTDGNTYTIQRGGSMPNAAIIEGKVYIIFSTMVNDTFCMMRCIYNPSTDNAESYSICKLADAPLTYRGLYDKGYNLDRFDDFYINKTLNMNAWYGNAKASDGTYYCGMCLCGSYKYPFVLTTQDFETFEVWKQIEQPHSRAMFELSVCLSNDGKTLYTALRNNARYIIVNEINISTKDIISTQYVRGAGSRPCLYLGHDNAVYMYYTMENARQSGRIMKVSDRNNQVKIVDIMQQVQYAEVQKADDDQNYFYFVFNRIFKVKPETYTHLQARTLIEKIMNL